MAGSRTLTQVAERILIRRIRRLKPRDRVLITARLFTGFRISEILSLTIGQVFCNGRIADTVGVRPAYLKGHYGSTRWVPVCPELRRSLEQYLALRARRGLLCASDPLFLSREHDASGQPKPLGRSAAEKFIGRILRQIAKANPQQLSSHSLRKSWARRLYEKSGHDLMLVRDGLGHSSVSVTQAYLSVDRDCLEEFIVAGDWTKRPRKVKPATLPLTTLPLPVQPATILCLPGFEHLVA
jgi:integrase